MFLLARLTLLKTRTQKLMWKCSGETPASREKKSLLPLDISEANKFLQNSTLPWRSRQISTWDSSSISNFEEQYFIHSLGYTVSTIKTEYEQSTLLDKTEKV